MGLDYLFGKSVYLDSNIFIYAIEGFDKYRSVLVDLFTAVEGGNIIVVTSELTLAECLVKPFKDNNKGLEEVYTSHILGSGSLTLIPIDRDCLIKSAELRGKTNLKLPDAIHVASAIGYGCDLFLTNDVAIKNAGILEVITLSDFN